ncbi:Adenine-specific methyltransferase [hydrothermal vent metagenome]|uniref:site-specific DNA-methyltransferase (adenine-specific) n=1 Tax=hydrothermal vent metagenome TaxID=652676 RepID=A0A3B1DN75_9ZZZZ
MASLFDDIIVESPKTQSIKYAGSKLKLLTHILELAAKTKAHTVLDGFSGSTRVSQAFAKSGYSVVSNDIAVWSQHLATCYLLNTHPSSHYCDLIDHLNSVEPKTGWFTENYGGEANEGSSIQEDGLKKPWQVHNTQKLDAIRDEIDLLSLSPVEKSVALTSLLLAMDCVDNTLGHFVSYLKNWSPRSYKQLQLKVPAVFQNHGQHRVIQSDVFEAASTDVDLVYYDPPYGSNNEKMPPSRVRYASYYHLWATLCLNDKPELFGKAKRRTDTSDTISASVFEEFRRSPESGRFQAVESIEKLIQKTAAKWIILSYSSGGRATADELNDVLTANGKIIEVIEVDYRRNVMAGMKWTSEWIREVDSPNREFLFLLENKKR